MDNAANAGDSEPPKQTDDVAQVVADMTRLWY